MSEEAKGTLNDIKSIDEKDKASLVNLAVTAANDLIFKKGRKSKPKTAIVDLTEKEGIKYQVTAINKCVLATDWYKAILRSINTLQKHLNIDSEIVNEISTEQSNTLKIRLQELTPRLEELILRLSKN